MNAAPVRERRTVRFSDRVEACGLSPHYQEIFAITRLADYMPVFGDEASALTARVGA